MAHLNFHNHPAVAYLRFRHSERLERDVIPIHANDQFDIGRAHVQSVWNTHEPTISTHHLRFRCVVYEDDDEQQVAPMIYARVLSQNQVRLERAGLDDDAESNPRGGPTMVSKTDPDVLLNHGDVLWLTESASLLFLAEGYSATGSENVDPTRVAELERISDQFHVTRRRLGVGGNASVFVAVKQNTKRQVACKVVELSSMHSTEANKIRNDSKLDFQQKKHKLRMYEARIPEKRSNLRREFEVSKDLNHPNIITLEKVICTSNNIYIFQELITGGDLLSYIDQKGILCEAESAVIVRQILKAVEYLHNTSIVHRDIKPENILMTSWRDGARLVLTDFGQARTIDDAKAAAASKSTVFRMRTVVGTYGYTAPEALRQMKKYLQKEGYSKAIDIWSIGCITALLLTSEHIFPPEADDYDMGKTPTTETNPISPHHRDLSIMDRGEAWRTVGRKVKSFIRGCLVLDEGERLTAKQALLHPWFTNRHYAMDIEAAYQRAIRDWTPREKIGNLIEFIDTSDVAPAASSRAIETESLAGKTTSHFFQTKPAALSNLLASTNGACGMGQQQRARTPLPTIHDEVDEETLVPDSPQMAGAASMPSNPVNAAYPTQYLFADLTSNKGPSSFNSFATPFSQFRAGAPSIATQQRSVHGLTQSQGNFEELSLPPPPIADGEWPSLRKRMFR